MSELLRQTEITRESVWVTRDRQRVKISEMTDRHLLATITMLCGHSPIGTSFRTTNRRRWMWVLTMTREAIRRGLTHPNGARVLQICLDDPRNSIHAAHAVTCPVCRCTRECDGDCFTCAVCGFVVPMEDPMSDEMPEPVTFTDAITAKVTATTTVDKDGVEHVSRHGLIALVYEPPGGYDEQPNAKLVTAAPELLNSLKGLIGLIDLIACRRDLPADLISTMKTSYRYTDAIAAVAKAEGVSQPADISDPRRV